MQLSAYKVRRSKIDHIFISHLHGDHYFGLIGLLTSLGLMGRQEPLHIYGPAQLEEIIRLQLSVANHALCYTLHFHPLGAKGIIAEGEKFTVESFPVEHRIPCWGFIFRDKKLPRKLLREQAIAAGIPAAFWHQLQLGNDYEAKTGERINNETVTIENTAGRSYAYCADTIYKPALAEIVHGVDLLYHEATYLHVLAERAAARFHTTARQAAMLAAQADVKRLVIGHFSSKYEVLDEFLWEAQEVFENTLLGLEGITVLF